MADAILGQSVNLGDPAELRQRIAKLEGNPREADPAWWNDLAGAHIRLGEVKVAAEMLESVVARFPEDYGIHANLGTAYHLLGRYAEAEKEIARDLELNPNAHFGLEKYHLALLRYLAKDAAYQKAHVYLDEFSEAFLREKWSDLGLMPMAKSELVESVDPKNPTNMLRNYQSQWKLTADTNRENGVLYMASLNPREPACFVMLGIECLAKDFGRGRDLNLAVAAFQKAIDLGSPQANVLRERIALIKEHLETARGIERTPYVVGGFLAIGTLFLALLFRWLMRRKPTVT